MSLSECFRSPFWWQTFPMKTTGGNKLSLPSQEGANQDPTSEGILILKRFGGYIEQVKDKTTLVSFGLESHLPPRLNALLAVQGGIKLLEYIDEVNRQRDLDKQSCLKVGIGIASGPVTVRCINDQRQVTDGLSGNTILTARKLHRYADFMKSSCLLINEEAYNCIAAVRHHFIFGRKGLVKLPGMSVHSEDLLR